MCSPRPFRDWRRPRFTSVTFFSDSADAHVFLLVGPSPYHHLHHRSSQGLPSLIYITTITICLPGFSLPLAHLCRRPSCLLIDRGSSVLCRSFTAGPRPTLGSSAWASFRGLDAYLKSDRHNPIQDSQPPLPATLLSITATLGRINSRSAIATHFVISG